MTNVLVPLADGVEEMEAVIIVDVLRRAGWNVITTAIENNPDITASRGVKLIPDTNWNDVDPDDFDCLLIPGGGSGTEILIQNARLLETIRSFSANGKIAGAICAGPLVLQKAGVLNNKKATCHPAVKDSLTVTPWLSDRVVIDGNIITSQAAGTTFEFALTIIEIIDGKQKADEVSAGLIPAPMAS